MQKSKNSVEDEQWLERGRLTEESSQQVGAPGQPRLLFQETPRINTDLLSQLESNSLLLSLWSDVHMTSIWILYTPPI